MSQRDVLVTGANSTGPYETGETVSNEYELWHDYRVDGYMDPGTYRWEERIRIFSVNDGGQGDHDEQLGSFRWGFDVDLELPETA